jgi:hypothetical protein
MMADRRTAHAPSVSGPTHTILQLVQQVEALELEAGRVLAVEALEGLRLLLNLSRVAVLDFTGKVKSVGVTLTDGSQEWLVVSRRTLTSLRRAVGRRLCV